MLTWCSRKRPPPRISWSTSSRRPTPTTEHSWVWGGCPWWVGGSMEGQTGGSSLVTFSLFQGVVCVWDGMVGNPLHLCTKKALNAVFFCLSWTIFMWTKLMPFRFDYSQGLPSIISHFGSCSFQHKIFLNSWCTNKPPECNVNLMGYQKACLSNHNDVYVAKPSLTLHKCHTLSYQRKNWLMSDQ